MKRLITVALSLLVASALAACDTSPTSPEAPGTERVAEPPMAVAAGPDIHVRGTPSDPLRMAPLIFVDGVKVREPVETGSLLHQMTPDDISRIEVVKGTTATRIHGAEARGGVIMIWTREYDEEFRPQHGGADAYEETNR